MNVTAHQEKGKNAATKTGKRIAGEERKRKQAADLKNLYAALLRPFRGQHSEKTKESARGNWTLGKANSHFDPTQTGSGTTPPR